MVNDTVVLDIVYNEMKCNGKKKKNSVPCHNLLFNKRNVLESSDVVVCAEDYFLFKGGGGGGGGGQLSRSSGCVTGHKRTDSTTFCLQ